MPPGVVGLLRFIVQVVANSVWGYFLTFVLCWFSILGTLTALITNYVNYLADLTLRLTTWPNNLLFLIGVAVALAGAALILHVILHGKSSTSRIMSRVPVGVPIETGCALGYARGGHAVTTTKGGGRKSPGAVV